MCFGDGEVLPSDVSLELFSLIRDQEFDVNLKNGDLLLLDNIQFAHGRRAFTGTRKINVALSNWTECMNDSKEIENDNTRS